MSQPAIVKGFDFTSAPKRSKPITCAYGVLAADVLEIGPVACITILKHLMRVTFIGDLRRRKLRSPFITISKWKMDSSRPWWN